MEYILRWVAGIVAAFKKRSAQIERPQNPLPHIATETRTESAVEETGAVATAAATTSRRRSWSGWTKPKRTSTIN
jgi:hypothetical protein